VDLIFFWLSKLIWKVIAPDTLLAILILAGVALLLAGAVKKAKVLLSVVALFILINAFLPLGATLLAPLENRFPSHPDLPDHVDGIICLGGAEDVGLSHARNQPELQDSAERYLGFVRLMRTYPKSSFVFTGGSGLLLKQNIKAADVARMIFQDLGIDTEKIIFECNSRNTYENALYSKALVNPVAGQNWVLVTTAWHMPRSVGVFRKAGWEVIPYPVDYSTYPGEAFSISFCPSLTDRLSLLSQGIKAWVGLTAYYLTGKTSQWVPGPVAGKG